MEVDTVGAAATAGLASAAIERPTGRAGEAHTHCTDCGAELVGRFCHACGQPGHIHRSLLHLAEEFLHGIMHFDGRVWRTLPMLAFRPGRLTREWVHGRRTRYVSPLAMFLFTAFLTFMILSLLPEGADRAPETLAQAKAAVSAEAGEEADKVAAAERALAAATAPGERAEARAALAEARQDLARAQAAVEQLERLEANGLRTGDWRRALEAQTGRNLSFTSGWPALDAKLAKAVKNPELFWYKFKNSFYKFSFLLVPLSIPFVALLFLWKRGFTLYDHGVFVLYSLTFVSLLVLVSVLAGRVHASLGVLAWGLFPWIVPLHMYKQLRGAYGLRRFSAAWRLFLLLFFCSIVSLLFLMLVAYLGL